MFYPKEPTERQRKICKLRKKAQYNEAALQLYRNIELECGMILRTPNSASECTINTYNRLVKESNLSLPEQARLLMEEKKK